MSAPLPPDRPSSDDATEALPNIADHVLIRPIGKGAYGEVWLARNVMGGWHAAKVIYRRTFSQHRPFEREFEGICRFEPISRSHPGLVTILQVGKNEGAGYFYYVMELADDARTGQKIEPDSYVPRTLSHEMAVPERIPLEKSLPISLSLACALEYLHEQKLIHRDIKPSNIIFVKGVPKFADIGLITEAGDDVSSVGSLNYMPPEGPGEPTGDIFSLGKVFYGLFMGMPCKYFPAPPGAAEEFMTVPALLQLNSLILKACHHDPRERFQTANELHKALLAVTETVQGKPPGIGVTAGKATSASEGRPVASGEQRPKARWPRMAALLVLLLLIAAGVFLAIKRDPIVVLMDTTARDGQYEPDIGIGGSNAMEVAKVLEKENFLPSRSLRQAPVSSGWAGEAQVIGMRPDLVIIHRSSFWHPVNAVLKLGKPPFTTKDTATNEEDEAKWKSAYGLADDKLILFMGIVAADVRQTKFLVYSRGTDPMWLVEDLRKDWVKRIEARIPWLKNRIDTMVIQGGYGKGSFKDPETGKELRKHVKAILTLPDKQR